MKVICIYNEYVDLTIGKIYEVKYSVSNYGFTYYSVKNDYGITIEYNEKFLVSLEEAREEKLKELLG